jgi:arylformamidase
VGAGFHSYNITTVIINYPLAPFVTIDQIGQSCRRALQWVSQHILNYNGNADQLYIAGHSAGGHLASMMITGFDGASTIQGIKGVCAMSGLFNLLPIQLSDINAVLHLDDKTVLHNSPVKLQPLIFCPVIIAVGGNEADEYKAQSEELFECWKDAAPVTLVRIEGANHYSIIEEAVKPRTDMHQHLKMLIGL